MKCGTYVLVQIKNKIKYIYIYICIYFFFLQEFILEILLYFSLQHPLHTGVSNLVLPELLTYWKYSIEFVAMNRYEPISQVWKSRAVHLWKVQSPGRACVAGWSCRRDRTRATFCRPWHSQCSAHTPRTGSAHKGITCHFKKFKKITGQSHLHNPFGYS